MSLRSVMGQMRLGASKVSRGEVLSEFAGAATGATIGALSADESPVLGGVVGSVLGGATGWGAFKGGRALNKRFNMTGRIQQARGRRAFRNNTTQFGPMRPQQGPVAPSRRRLAANRAMNNFRDALGGAWRNLVGTQGLTPQRLAAMPPPMAVPRTYSRPRPRGWTQR